MLIPPLPRAICREDLGLGVEVGDQIFLKLEFQTGLDFATNVHQRIKWLSSKEFKIRRDKEK